MTDQEIIEKFTEAFSTNPIVIATQSNTIPVEEYLADVEPNRLHSPIIGPINPEFIKENYGKIFPDNIRLTMGLYRTDEEDKEYRAKSLKRKLP